MGPRPCTVYLVIVLLLLVAAISSGRGRVASWVCSGWVSMVGWVGGVLPSAASGRVDAAIAGLAVGPRPCTVYLVIVLPCSVAAISSGRGGMLSWVCSGWVSMSVEGWGPSSPAAPGPGAASGSVIAPCTVHGRTGLCLSWLAKKCRWRVPASVDGIVPVLAAALLPWDLVVGLRRSISGFVGEVRVSSWSETIGSSMSVAVPMSVGGGVGVLACISG